MARNITNRVSNVFAICIKKANAIRILQMENPKMRKMFEVSRIEPNDLESNANCDSCKIKAAKYVFHDFEIEETPDDVSAQRYFLCVEHLVEILDNLSF